MTTRHARTDLRRRAVALLDQQLWCWGRDIARPKGNVLLGLGMCRHRCIDPGHGSTAYTGRVAGDGVVWLWGFGLVYCLPNLGGVFLRRDGSAPVLVDEPQQPVHLPEQLAPFVRPNTARQGATAGALIRAAAAWVAGYEHWVAETLGITYREATLAARDKKTAVPAKEMARAWEHLAKKSARLAHGVPSPLDPWGSVLTALQARAAVLSPQPTRLYSPDTNKRSPIQ